MKLTLNKDLPPPRQIQEVPLAASHFYDPNLYDIDIFEKENILFKLFIDDAQVTDPKIDLVSRKEYIFNKVLRQLIAVHQYIACGERGFWYKPVKYKT